MFYGLASSFSAKAGDLCDHYRRTSPRIYRMVCGSNGHRKANTAGARSSFSDGFNLNSGSLPTEPTGYGFETIGSYLRNDLSAWTPTFAIVKGYQRFGTGVSTSGNNTFYGNDVLRRARGPVIPDSFAPLERPEGKIANLNAGAAINLFSTKRGFSARLGLSARYNKTTGTMGGGSGLLFNTRSFTFGAGFTRERVSNFFGPIWFGSFFVGYKLSIFEVDYLVLTNSLGLGLKPIHVLTSTATLGRVLLTAAGRRLNYLPAGDVLQPYFAVQILVSSSLSIGTIYNYMPGSNSIAAQYFL